MDPVAHHLRVETPPARLEHVLQSFVRPVIAEVGTAFFARYQNEALLFVQGDEDWTQGPLRDAIEAHLRPLRETGAVVAETVAAYRPEVERYGGIEGMRIAETIFQIDSLPCLDLLADESAGRVARSRREVSLLLTERLLDLFGFDRQRRIAFHRSAYAWALEQGRWDADSLRLLEARYAEVRQGLAELAGASPQDAFGGREPARRAAEWSEATRPWIDALLAAHAAGRIAKELHALAWSYAHLQCNRLGIPADAEAILRFFMQRLHEDGLGKVA
jgi:thiopeptide-type bacteriocin biosynthesis protein